jgi:hypothetical protein
MNAECWFSSNHKPPEPYCYCGLCAVANIIDAIYRWRAMTSNIQRQVKGGCFPYRPSLDMSPVLTEVTLRRVVDHDDIYTAPIVWHEGISDDEVLRANIPVLRAASIEIERVFVPSEPMRIPHDPEPPSAETQREAAEKAAQLVDRLAANFGVEAVTGSRLHRRRLGQQARMDAQRSLAHRVLRGFDAARLHPAG